MTNLLLCDIVVSINKGGLFYLSEPIWVNYHKHSSLSNRYMKDSPLLPVDYWNELKARYGDQPCIYTTVEHGWAGNYFKQYDDLEKFNKKNHTNIRWIYGCEAYWVKNRHEQDKSNCHIILLARNDNGRKAINKIVSIANKDGYYFRPRIDLELINQLPPNDVMITTACVAFWNRYDDIDFVVKSLAEKFPHFYLEVQAHNTTTQKEINQHILDLHYQWKFPLIAGCDSHVITEAQMKDRDDLLESGHIHYEDEDGWYMDYPTYDVLFQRFKEQDVLDDDEIKTAIDNTNVIFDFEDIKLDRSLKVPVIKSLRNKTQDERNRVFENILKDEWKAQKSDINTDKLLQYQTEIRHDINEIESCNMADYFILSYYIMKYGQEKYGGILTPSGRGSAVSMYLNKLLRLTKVDKVNSPVLMYSERFLTKERVLDSHTPPDIDNNVSVREPFIEAQRELVGELGTYDLLALGTLKLKAAWKMYSRAYNIEPETANEVSKQIDRYETAKKHAEDGENVDIHFYIDPKYKDLIDGCQKYLGIYDTAKGHPCGCLCYEGDIESEIGISLCKSEATGKEALVANIESGTIDAFGYLKQDYLVVDSVGLTYDVYKEAGLEPFTVNELLAKIEHDDATWQIYSDGYTQCVNQCEQPKSTQKVMRYKPKNISELTQFIAGIRPGFQSMYHLFESRQHFEYGIKALDDLIQDEYRTSSFIIYQEDLMKVLEFAGFPMSETYTIIKAISKKKDYVIKEAKPKFISGFAKAIMDTGETDDENVANELAEKVWHIVEDNSAYGFNCVSGDTVIKLASSKNNSSVEQLYNMMENGEITEYGYGWSVIEDSRYNMNGRIFPNKIIGIYKQPKAVIYEITTKQGHKIKATKNHKFITRYHGILKLEELLPGDQLLTANIGEITYPAYATIQSIEEIGIETVYDIEMSGDVAHNFVLANGLVTCNSAHAYCMAIDSVTIAYLKAHYPLEFYKCVLQRFTDKGEKDKVSLIKQEMLKRGYKLKDIQFGDDNRQFNVDRVNNCIVQTMTSIKDMPKTAPQALYELGQKGIKNRADLYQALMNDSRINSKACDILFKLGYFSKLCSNPNRLMAEYEIYQKYISTKVLTKSKFNDTMIEQIRQCAGKESDKQFRDIDNKKLISLFIKQATIQPYSIVQQIKWQIELLGYSNLTDSTRDANDWIITNIEKNSYGSVFLSLYNICYGANRRYKLSKQYVNKSSELSVGDVVRCVLAERNKWRKNETGEFVKSTEMETYVKCYKRLEDKA